MRSRPDCQNRSVRYLRSPAVWPLLLAWSVLSLVSALMFYPGGIVPGTASICRSLSRMTQEQVARVQGVCRADGQRAGIPLAWRSTMHSTANCLEPEKKAVPERPWDMNSLEVDHDVVEARLDEILMRWDGLPHLLQGRLLFCNRLLSRRVCVVHRRVYPVMLLQSRFTQGFETRSQLSSLA